MRWGISDVREYFVLAHAKKWILPSALDVAVLKARGYMYLAALSSRSLASTFSQSLARVAYPPSRKSAVMSELSIDETFKTCYEKFDTYPTNLIYKTSYHTTLERQRKRLTLEESKLFAPEKHLDIGFRDFDFKGKWSMFCDSVHFGS